MITCEICGTQAEQHDHWRHEIMARVAALEDVVTREPPADGEKTASAGEATVPTGWKLAPGWRVDSDAPDSDTCMHIDADGAFDCRTHVLFGRADDENAGACAAHAVEMGTLARDETPAEQPTGCPGCACCNDDACETKHADCHHAEQPSRQETGGGEAICGHGNDEDCPDCFWALQRDRAKTKAAESSKCRGCGRALVAVNHCMADGCPCNSPGGVNHGLVPSNVCVCDACDPEKTGSVRRPSGAGQLPSAPAGFRVVGRSGPDVTQSKGLWIRRARDCRDDSPANGEPRQIAMPGSLGGVWDLGEYDILEPIAEPPAPAAGTLNAEAALMGHQQAALLRRIDELHAKLAQAERERDERGRQVEKMAEHVAKMRMELDEASWCSANGT